MEKIIKGQRQITLPRAGMSGSISARNLGNSVAVNRRAEMNI